MKQLLAALAVFLGWSVGAGLAMALGAAYDRPLAGLAAALLLAGLLLHFYLLGGADRAERLALIRVRPIPRPALGWVALAVPALMATSLALQQVWVQLVPVPPESFSPYDELMRTPLQRLSLTVLAVALAPVLEEFFFRGLIQHSLERRLGAGRGIVVAAALFAGFHLLPWIFPLHLFLGVAFGYAVHATRSIWAGVVLHAANNAVAVVGTRWQSTGASPTVWDTGPTTAWWASVAALVVSLALLGWTARGLHAAGACGPTRARGSLRP
jgi:membrane protease YdiL (CAAX protease family)